jgi:hypothetical protein
MKVRIKLANPFRTIDNVLTEILNALFSSNHKTINDKLDKLQADFTLIKAFLGIEGTPVTDADLKPLTEQLRTSAEGLDESVKANQSTP